MSIAEDQLLVYIKRGYFQVLGNGVIVRLFELHNNKWRRCKPRVATQPSGDYLSVSVKMKRGYKQALAHRVVYRWFRGRIPPNYVINHIDGNKRNNHPKNLEAITQAENVQHAKNILKVGPWNKK